MYACPVTPSPPVTENNEWNCVECEVISLPSTSVKPDFKRIEYRTYFCKVFGRYLHISCLPPKLYVQILSSPFTKSKNRSITRHQLFSRRFFFFGSNIIRLSTIHCYDFKKYFKDSCTSKDEQSDLCTPSRRAKSHELIMFY